jgi:5-formaminoimidazole-4-carboxamide-1-(beta)-D-ribofuranosyl 5'-monophosphate synthetase
MIKEQIVSILKNYRKNEVKIGTIGSHTALNIFKGAKDEGFKTTCICNEKDAIIYKRFGLVDEFIFVEDFGELLDRKIQEKLRKLNTILVPHGSFNAYISAEKMMNELEIPIFGNRKLLAWETDREKQRAWLRKANLTLPRTFKNLEEINRLTIVKFSGARGGKGYFLTSSPENFHLKANAMISKSLLSKEDPEKIHLQEYIVGVNVYPQYFRSTVRSEVELLGFDKRYESTVDGIGRIPANEQLQVNPLLTYTIVGNISLTVRESLLSEYLRMGDAVVKVSEEIAPPGIIGPFCLETVVTESLKIYCFEISARIVAGTNVGISTSPYAYLKHGSEMYMGRRIAKEIKEALQENSLEKIVT